MKKIEKSKQSWESCKYAFKEIDNNYGCEHPQVVQLEGYTKVNLCHEEDSKNVYVQFYPDRRFHEFPKALEAILKICEEELKVECKGETLCSQEEVVESVLRRALASCKHCKFYEAEF